MLDRSEVGICRAMPVAGLDIVIEVELGAINEVLQARQGGVEYQSVGFVGETVFAEGVV